MTGSFPVVDHLGGSVSDGTHIVTKLSGQVTAFWDRTLDRIA
jgi:hypothetical protein